MTLQPSQRVIPAPELYWAVLDTSSLPPARPLDRAGHERRLGYLFEHFLPVPIEDVHPAYLPIGEQRVLACALDRQTLCQLTDETTLSLIPSKVPPALNAQADPARLNLLRGEFEPPARRHTRRRSTLVTAAAISLCAALLWLGLARRTHALRQETIATRAAETELYRSAGLLDEGVPGVARLTAELRTLERTRTHTPPDREQNDAGSLLGALLISWPNGLRLRTDSISVAPATISLRAIAPDPATAAQLQRSLQAPPGWRMLQPTVRTERDGVAMHLRFAPELDG